MENKYYTPDLEEFHVGFEFESRMNDEDWEKQTYKQDSFISVYADGEYSFDNIDGGINLRVKHLDREDIESEGWIQIEYDTYKNEDFYLEFNNEYKTFISEKKAGMENIVFAGNIKNKSELRRIMKQLNIE